MFYFSNPPLFEKCYLESSLVMAKVKLLKFLFSEGSSDYTVIIMDILIERAEGVLRMNM